jgi:hypothetical protein
MPDRLSDEDVSRQILGVFMRHRIPATGTLQRNYFFDVRDSDFQRGINKAVANNWITIDLRNRYRYHLTTTGYASRTDDRSGPRRIEPDAMSAWPIADIQRLPLANRRTPRGPVAFAETVFTVTNACQPAGFATEGAHAPPAEHRNPAHTEEAHVGCPTIIDVAHAPAFLAMSNPRHAQSVAVGPDDGRDDRYAMSCFCERKEVPGCTAFHRDFWLDLGEPTDGIECLADDKARIQKQQRIGREGPDVDRLAELELERGLANGQKLNRRHNITPEGPIFGLNRMQQNSEVNVAALKHGKDIRANRLNHSQIDFGITLSERCNPKEPPQSAPGSGHLERAGVSALQRFRTFADCFSMGQQCTALCQHCSPSDVKDDSRPTRSKS